MTALTTKRTSKKSLTLLDISAGPAKPTITKTPYAWKLEDREGNALCVSKNINGKLSIITKDNHDAFKFNRSEPELVEAIGRLLIESAKV